MTEEPEWVKGTKCDTHPRFALYRLRPGELACALCGREYAEELLPPPPPEPRGPYR